MKKIGIYKITNPKSCIYIGQSANIEFRFENYKKIRCKNQKKLYASFVKYGVENHTFEIIKECEINELNYYERHYQEYYDVLGEFGLNLKLTNVGEKKVIYSQETCKKISDSLIGSTPWNKGKKMSDSAIEKNRNAQLKKYADGFIHPMKGKKNPLISEKQMGSKNHMYGKKNIVAKKRMVGNEINNKMVFNIINGFIYKSCKEAWELNYKGICAYSSFKSMVNGSVKNKTNFIYA
jgi:group I intron endonuclease